MFIKRSRWKYDRKYLNINVSVHFLEISDALHEDFIINLSNGAVIAEAAVREGNKTINVIIMCVRVCVKSRSTMEDLDVPQMRREVESLQYQLNINREKSSITVTE